MRADRSCRAGRHAPRFRLAGLAIVLLLAWLGFTPARAAAQSEPPCAGDCDGSGTVTIDELIAMVLLALQFSDGSPQGQPTPCAAADLDASGSITVDEIIAAVNRALLGCMATPTPTLGTPTEDPTLTPTPMATDTQTPTPTVTATDTPISALTPTVTARFFVLSFGSLGGSAGGTTQVSFALEDADFDVFSIDFDVCPLSDAFDLSSDSTACRAVNGVVFSMAPTRGKSCLEMSVVSATAPDAIAPSPANLVECSLFVRSDTLPGVYGVRLFVTLRGPDGIEPSGVETESITVTSRAGGPCDFDDQCNTGTCRGRFCCEDASCPAAGNCLQGSGACITPTMEPTPEPTRTPAGLGPEEFQVNTYERSSQESPSLAADADGNFVVAWTSFDQDGFGTSGVFAQRYSSDGTPLGGEFQVNTSTTSMQSRPAVAADASGNFAVVWLAVPRSDFDVLAQRFSADGSPNGTEFRVNSHTAGFQFAPAVAADEDGDLVVAWHGPAPGSTSADVFAQRFASDGSAQGAEFQVNSYTPSFQAYPALASSASGDFVVAWLSDAQDGSGYGVFARRFASDGSAAGTEFQVNDFTINLQRDPAVAVDADGDFMVAWAGFGGEAYGFSAFARRFASDGGPLGTAFRTSSYTVTLQAAPALTADPLGDFVITWLDYARDGYASGLFVRRFASDGAPIGEEFQVNTHTGGMQIAPAVAARGAGSFVVVWQSDTQDASSNGIIGRLFDGAP